MKIALTQRADYFPDRKEWRDSLDQNWYKLFKGETLIPVPNMIKSFKQWSSSFDFDLVILTGGNDIEYSTESQNVCLKRDSVERQILAFSKEANFPVLGICRGLQMMNLYEGGGMSYDNQLKIEPHSVFLKTDKGEMEEEVTVNSFHKWFIPSNKISEKFKVLAADCKGCVEAVVHVKHPWLGVMWHPERTQQDCSKYFIAEFVANIK